jgi:hypothetical protein
VVFVETGVDYELGRIALDRDTSLLCTEDMGDVCAGFQGRNCCIVRGTRIVLRTANYSYFAKLAFMEGAFKFG